MLILNRRVNQAIKIGDDIKIVIVGNHRDNVLVGIDAPKDVQILRTELFSKKFNYKTKKYKNFSALLHINKN